MPNRPDRLSRSGPTTAPQKPEGALEMANAADALVAVPCLIVLKSEMAKTADAPAAPSAGNCNIIKRWHRNFPVRASSVQSQ